MTLKHFIERPVLASVISIVIVIAGLIGLATLPVEQYPDIAPPTVMVHASYPGASAETIQKSVIVPLEQAINGVEDMTYMTSSAAVGSASVTIYFRQGTNADMAAVNVQNKVSRATGQLPPDFLCSLQHRLRQTGVGQSRHRIRKRADTGQDNARRVLDHVRRSRDFIFITQVIKRVVYAHQIACAIIYDCNITHR